MQLVRFDPFRDIEKNFEKLWGRGWASLPTFSETAVMDMYEEDGKLVAELTLPNFSKDEVKVSSDKDALEISAEHKEKEETKGKRRYYFRESSDQFLRRVTLPEGVDADKAVASFKNSILKITMPIKASEKAKTVRVT